MYEFITDVPRCTDVYYKQKYTKKVEVYNETKYSKIYRGSGIAVSEHPYNDRCMMKAQCGNCKSSDVEAIYAGWSVNVGTGDAKISYELHCNKCNKFTTRGMDD
jgi:hypothetical protein